MTMNEITAGIDWIAVGVGTVAAFLLGWAWYSPMLFGKRWAEGVGLKLESAQAMPVAAMVAQLIATFLLAWVVGVTAAQNALATMILVMATIVLIVVANGLFAKKSGYAIAVESSFVAAMALVMVVVQAII
jgi:hypothetical protein